MLSIPRFVAAAEVRGVKPSFKLDLGTLNALEEIEVSSVWTRTRKASEHAKLAFAAAALEWIAWRLDGVADVQDLLRFAEGLWAAAIDYRYTRTIEHPAPRSREGMEQLLHMTWQTANGLLRLCPEGAGRADHCVRLVVFARHVLPKSRHTVLKDWTAAILERIRTHWPMDPKILDENERQGPPVPRAAFDPSVPYDPTMDEKLLREFLASLDPKENPYLRSPAEMKKAGFPGTPYQL